MALIGENVPGETPLTDQDLQGLKLPLLRTRAQLSAVEGPNIVSGKEWALGARRSQLPEMLFNMLPAPASPGTARADALTPEPTCSPLQRHGLTRPRTFRRLEPLHRPLRRIASPLRRKRRNRPRLGKVRRDTH